MKLRFFKVNSFASRRVPAGLLSEHLPSARTFKGNPAAVVPLERWLPDSLMQSIALENNLSETAFFVLLEQGHYHIRWFSPTAEAKLCGHATLAAAWVILNHLDPGLERVCFESMLSPLEVVRDGDKLVLDFPVYPPQPCPVPAGLLKALGVVPLETWTARNSVYVLLESESAVRAARPNLALLERVEVHGAVLTAPGDGCDFVSRNFVPRMGIPEDPVTGGVHTTLVPLWAEKLGKTELYARQVSARGGELWCRLEGDRVFIAGYVAPYLEGTIEVINELE